MKKPILLFSLFLSLSIAAFAQESPNFKLKEDVFNGGGNPDGGIILTSLSFKLTLDSIGENIVATSLISPSFRMDGGFVPPYIPPREVLNLLFQSDHQTLVWDPERSRGSYNLYRDLLSSLSGYGACNEHGIIDETTADSDEPSPGDGYFYLVTVKNRLYEEGIKGSDSSGTERPNPSPCP